MKATIAPLVLKAELTRPTFARKRRNRLKTSSPRVVTYGTDVERLVNSAAKLCAEGF
jgi:hypothetical protein